MSSTIATAEEVADDATEEIETEDITDEATEEIETEDITDEAAIDDIA